MKLKRDFSAIKEKNEQEELCSEHSSHQTARNSLKVELLPMLYGNKLDLLRNSRFSIRASQSNYIPLPSANSGRDSQLLNYQQQQQLQGQISQEQQPKKTIFVGSGWNYDIDNVIGFDDDKMIINKNDKYERVTINEEIKFNFDLQKVQENIQEHKKPLSERIPKIFQWILIFYATINNSFIPPWILSIPAEKYLRIAWRFYMQAWLLIPFCMYEYRKGDQRIKKQYSLKNIFGYGQLKKIYIASFQTSLWFTMVLFGFEWTYVSHSIMLASQTNLVMSLLRAFKKEQNHSIESAGQFMCFIGIFLVMLDTWSLTKEDANPSAFTFKMTKHLFREKWQRFFFGDCVALSVSYWMCKLSAKTTQIKNHYPPHLNMCVVSFLNSINMTLSSYFFSGTDVSTSGSFWGWAGLFSSDQFSTYFFMSIILSLGTFLTFSIITKLFEPMFPAIASSFEPVIATLFVHFAGVQHAPGEFTCLGYVFLVPGQFIIIIGQQLLRELG